MEKDDLFSEYHFHLMFHHFPFTSETSDVSLFTIRHFPFT